MFRHRIASVVAVVLMGIAVLVAATAGYAYWTEDGEGGGSGGTGTLDAVVVTASAATPTSLLLPGGDASAAFRVTNPNHFDVVITSVVRDGDITVSGGSACDAASAHVTFTDQTGLAITVPANAIDHQVELDGAAVAMGGTAADGCQSAVFDIPIHVSVQMP